MSLKAMLLCAVQRSGKPLTASELHDACVALAMDSEWPRPAYSIWSPKKVAATLRNMETEQLVERAGTIRIEGNERDTWRPKGLMGEFWKNPDFPIPDPPDRADKHALDAMSRMQQITAFDALGDVVAAGVRLRRNCEEVLARELGEFDATVARARRQLLAVGLVGGDEP